MLVQIGFVKKKVYLYNKININELLIILQNKENIIE